MEKLKKEQITFMIRPDVLKRIDAARMERLWNRSRFLEEASIYLLAKLDRES